MNTNGFHVEDDDDDEAFPLCDFCGYAAKHMISPEAARDGGVALETLALEDMRSLCGLCLETLPKRECTDELPDVQTLWVMRTINYGNHLVIANMSKRVQAMKELEDT